MEGIGDEWLVQLFRPETSLIGGGTTFVEVSSGWRPLNNFTFVQSSSDENHYLSCGQLITATMNAAHVNHSLKLPYGTINYLPTVLLYFLPT